MELDFMEKKLGQDEANPENPRQWLGDKMKMKSCLIS